MQIASTEGEGTSVAMLLPVAKPQQAADTDADADDAASPAAPAETSSILVVEDDQRVLAATVDAVEELGYEPVACGNPRDAEALVEGGWQREAGST